MSNKFARASGRALANEPISSGLLAEMDPAEVHYFNRYLSMIAQGAPEG